MNQDRRLTLWPISPAPRRCMSWCFSAGDPVNSQRNKHSLQNRPQVTNPLKTDEKSWEIRWCMNLISCWYDLSHVSGCDVCRVIKRHSHGGRSDILGMRNSWRRSRSSSCRSRCSATQRDVELQPSSWDTLVIVCCTLSIINTSFTGLQESLEEAQTL